MLLVVTVKKSLLWILSLQRRKTPYKQVLRDGRHTLDQGEAEHLGDFILKTGSIFWLGGETATGEKAHLSLAH